MAERAPRHRRLIGSARTNLPRWPQRPAAIDPHVAGVLLVGSGPAIAAWQDEARARGLPVRHVERTEVADGLAPALAALTVGWRMMIDAPVAEAGAIVAQAHAAGLIDAEIAVCAHEDGRIAVWCARCRARSVVVGEPGATIGCPGCGKALIVHHHHSVRLGALVGAPMLDES